MAIPSFVGQTTIGPIAIVGRHDCPDCGARLQRVVVPGAGASLRCPWTQGTAESGFCGRPKPCLPASLAYVSAGFVGKGALVRDVPVNSPIDEPSRAQIELARELCEECPPEETPAYRVLVKAQMLAEPH